MIQDLKSHLSHFVGDSVFFLCGSFEFQLWDISDEETSQGKKKFQIEEKKQLGIQLEKVK